MPISTPQLQALTDAAAALSQASGNMVAVIASIPVDASPAPPPPPAPAEWTQVAVEGAAFTVPAGSTVRYGAEGVGWTQREVSGDGLCNTTFFNSIDPAPEVLKVCQLLTGSQPPAPPPPPPAPPPPAPPPPAPPPPSGQTVYFAASGSNANHGTLEQPKRDLSGFDLNAHDPAVPLRFNCGDTFQMPQLKLRNLLATAAQRLTFEAYGTGAKPALDWSWVTYDGGAGWPGIEFGLNFSDGTAHGGYLFRGLNLVAPQGTGQTWGFWCKGSVSDVRVEDCDLTNWYMSFEGQGGHNATRIEVLRCAHPGNRGMCVHGCYYGMLIEDADLSSALSQSSHFVHRVYLRNGSNAVLRRVKYESALPCQGGTFTFHGRMDGVLVEECEALYGAGSDEGAWPISFFPDAPAGTEGGFTGVVLRGNTVRNPGNNGMHAECCPDALIEGNVVELTSIRNTVAIVHRNDNELPINLAGTCTMRNNVARGPVGSNLSFSSAPGSVDENNTVEYF